MTVHDVITTMDVPFFMCLEHIMIVIPSKDNEVKRVKLTSENCNKYNDKEVIKWCIQPMTIKSNLLSSRLKISCFLELRINDED